MSSLKDLASKIAESRHCVAFTGAGISAESGIPTYRGKDGLWGKYDPSKYASIGHFLEDPSYYWNFFQEVRYPLLKKARPNPGHLALAELESLRILKAVITQNIDGLHQEAGSSNVIELHGTTRTITCMDCSRNYTLDEAYSFLEKENPPRCSKCNGVLRPAVIFFGETLRPGTLYAAYAEAEKCDVFLAVGSSLVVHPAAGLPLRAKEKGATLAIVNMEPTPFDSMGDFVFHEEAGRVLPQIVQELKIE